MKFQKLINKIKKKLQKTSNNLQNTVVLLDLNKTISILEKVKKRAFIRSLFSSHHNKICLTRICFKNPSKRIKPAIKKSLKLMG
jgi:hypothetical protein